MAWKSEESMDMAMNSLNFYYNLQLVKKINLN